MRKTFPKFNRQALRYSFEQVFSICRPRTPDLLVYHNQATNFPSDRNLRAHGVQGRQCNFSRRSVDAWAAFFIVVAMD